DQPPPKSTGRERFGIEFADRLIALVRGAGGSANDAVATATALTAETVARGIERWTRPPPPPPPLRAPRALAVSAGAVPNAAGVGGFISSGGTRDAVGALTRDLRQGAGRPLLIGADLERGVAQQVQGMTELPPAAALGFLGDLEATRTAGVITGSEARTLGINWAFGPVCDLDLEPKNPIVQTRSFGSEPLRVGEHAAAWLQGLQEHGVLGCAKHYPGHGRTLRDSHET